ncbi:MAG: HAD family hydrolase [Patescibacteria group bacterium]|nr:HAD family hydrolase [Patescibacteria group bacterium]
MPFFDRAYVDLDDTLYDTRQFKEDIFQVFASVGISHDDFIRAYRRAAELPVLGYFNYTFPKQIEAVREQGCTVDDEILPRLEDLLKKDYILPNAEEFLRFLKTICRRVVLLTAGNRSFQAAKISATGLVGMVDEVVQIDGGKDGVLAPFVSAGEKILFINDNLDENKMIKEKFSAVAVVSVFNASYWTEQEFMASEIPWFKTLNEIKNYLAKQYGEKTEKE